MPSVDAISAGNRLVALINSRTRAADDNAWAYLWTVWDRSTVIVYLTENGRSLGWIEIDGEGRRLRTDLNARGLEILRLAGG